MATVRITKQFIDDVRRHIDELTGHAVRLAVGALDSPTIPKALGYEFIKRVAWGEEHVHWADQMPQKWRVSSGSMDFRVSIAGVRTHSFRVSFPAQDMFPPKFNSYHDHDLTLAELEKYASLYPDAGVVLDYVRKEQTAREIRAKWSTTRQQVTDFFQACASVNKALATEPAMRMYVPRQYLLKMEEEAPTRVKRELPTIDAVALAAQAVEISLAQSIHGGAL